MRRLLIGITGFEIIDTYTLNITFSDGKQQTIDFEPVLFGYYYEPLRDPGFFKRVSLDSEIHTLVWPNDADFDPATLYNWHKGEGEELAKRAANWQKTKVETGSP